MVGTTWAGDGTYKLHYATPKLTNVGSFRLLDPSQIRDGLEYALLQTTAECSFCSKHSCVTESWLGLSPTRTIARGSQDEASDPSESEDSSSEE